MKKSAKIALTAALFASAALSSCGPDGSSDTNSVYGKVPNVSPPASAAESFDPSKEEPQDVYGPAPDFEESEEAGGDTSPDSDDTSLDDSEAEYVPPADIVPTVYGPPPTDYDPEDEEPQDVYGPAPDFD